MSLDNYYNKLDEYYKLINESPVYTNFIILYPIYEWRYFDTQ